MLAPHPTNSNGSKHPETVPDTPSTPRMYRLSTYLELSEIPGTAPGYLSSRQIRWGGALGFALLLLGIIMRVLPHMPNFSPIAAIALFGSVYLKRKQALVLPLVALLASDVVLGFDSLGSRLTVYGAFVIIGLIGLQVRKRKSIATVAAGTLSGSVVFYLVTNFVYFHPGTMYPHTLNGVLASYYNALPFFRYTLLGDLFFASILFGLYELVLIASKRKTKLSIA